jgi:hypothetical protein
VDAILEGARTEKIGDGKMFVSSLEEVVRIRNGGIGKAAVLAEHKQVRRPGAPSLLMLIFST